MIALLSALGGLLGSLLPSVVQYFKAKQDNAHELAILNLQIERDKMGHAQRIEEINVQADVKESEAVYQFADKDDGWIGALNASVRPIITYGFVGVWAYTRWASGFVWTETDTSMLFAILGFWFGSRSLQKYMRK